MGHLMQEQRPEPLIRVLRCLQELSQWRSERAQEALKNSVLDEEAAARFSTAAALAQKQNRDRAPKTGAPPQSVCVISDPVFALLLFRLRIARRMF